jgi:transposase InsO family protein
MASLRSALIFPACPGTILDDYFEYIIAWKLCTTMRAKDVTETLELALEALGCDQAEVIHKPRTEQPNNLRNMYANGDGVLKDYNEAAKWYRVAADQGSSFAQSTLGITYDGGLGVPQDYIQAHMWWTSTPLK